MSVFSMTYIISQSLKTKLFFQNIVELKDFIVFERKSFNLMDE